MNYTKSRLFISLRSVIILSIAAGLASCDPGQPKSNSDLTISGFAAPLSQSEFNSLTAEQQYQVASKLYGTFFRGISAEDFFNLDAGTASLSPKSSTFLSDTRNALSTQLTSAELLEVNTLIEGFDEEGNPNEEDAKYEFNTDSRADVNQRAMQIPLARIKEYPVSRDLYVQWMAYFLSNTIMYSPAVEMETTDTLDAQNMYSFLSSRIKDKQSVREMIRGNLPSLARWRVSRSSENHALEAYELYLGLFETEEDSVKGGIACKDFFLTDEDSGYIISNTGIENTEPQLILETSFITTCNDLYDVIAGHPLVMPRAVEVLVNYIFSGRSREDRVSLINSITSSGVETYEDIFTAMIFSREYLLNTERPKSFEENFLPLLDNLKWDPASVSLSSSVGKRIFENMITNTGHRLYLGNKGWHNMTLKIGRLPDVPMDALSFANYHKGIRENFLLNEVSYIGSQVDIPGLIYTGVGGSGDDDLRDVIAQLNLTDYMHFLFLNVLQRKATDLEMTDLIAIYEGKGHVILDTEGLQVIRPDAGNNRHKFIAEIAFDYISRLPEFYYFKSIN
ncbi:MAG: hypothetical protein GQ549_05630 [Gammaproteobacteria bacterium]|nr:hypothetical protein [Gammaproteobacteria bacterium]